MSKKGWSFNLKTLDKKLAYNATTYILSPLQVCVCAPPPGLQSGHERPQGDSEAAAQVPGAGHTPLRRLQYSQVLRDPGRDRPLYGPGD